MTTSTLDANVEPRYGVKNWSETRWNGCWNAEDGAGLYIHAGRYRHDIDLWWAQVVAYLPGGQLCVERFWGANTSQAGLTAGGLDLEIVQDGWSATFDGAGQLTTIDQLARAPRGSSAPFRRMRFEVTARAAAPEWNMYAATTGRLEFAGDAHVQQGYHTTGTLRIGTGDEYRLDGIGFKDHSSGVREFENWYGHRYFMIVTDAWTCHAIVMLAPDGRPLPPWGAFMRGGDELKVAVARFELPLLEDSAGGPVHGDAVIEIETGEVFEFASELIHALPMTITEDNDMINGVDWELDGDPVVLIEGKGRLTAPDGTIAYCFHERTARRNRLTLPA
jgi:hypothetical protein